ncbi:hypothetical protein GALMADRAFT_233908 [Galerina marginata CBS 339.88]|uniref:Uncharacterized protein n=1 Tax=Galerina marginata (strain CBS 339.88) TaxID=685588 RepID=A0A067TPR3_GALM3|nr:hypothetical protein GALMADRAFT_233908 [Galerina marginata CBS 339.88]
MFFKLDYTLPPWPPDIQLTRMRSTLKKVAKHWTRPKTTKKSAGTRGTPRLTTRALRLALTTFCREGSLGEHGTSGSSRLEQQAGSQVEQSNTRSTNCAQTDIDSLFDAPQGRDRTTSNLGNRSQARRRDPTIERFSTNIILNRRHRGNICR